MEKNDQIIYDILMNHIFNIWNNDASLCGELNGLAYDGALPFYQYLPFDLEDPQYIHKIIQIYFDRYEFNPDIRIVEPENLANLMLDILREIPNIAERINLFEYLTTACIADRVNYASSSLKEAINENNYEFPHNKMQILFNELLDKIDPLFELVKEEFTADQLSKRDVQILLHNEYFDNEEEIEYNTGGDLCYGVRNYEKWFFINEILFLMDNDEQIEEFLSIAIRPYAREYYDQNKQAEKIIFHDRWQEIQNAIKQL